jgi:hypothetical protein
MELANEAGFFRRVRQARIAGFCFLAFSLLLTGCGHATRKVTLPSAQSIQPAPITGISPCDVYLNNYLACHRTAGIYTPDTLQAHYQAMRASLVQDASDPRTRPYLANRCIGLQAQMSAALKGRSCSPQTAVNGSTSTH